MTFLNPWLLFGLLGAGVPLVIHLLSRRTAQRVDFSSLEFLRDLERKSMRRLRVRQWLLLLLRMLLVAALALAMARPTLTGVAAGTAGGSTSAVILLDGSFSMRAELQGESLFRRAQDRAAEILSTFDDGDEIILLIPGAANGSRAEGIRDLALVRDRVESATPGRSSVDGQAELRRAVRRLQEARHPNREIHVLTDFQRSGWENAGEAAAEAAGVHVFFHSLTDETPANAWVDEVDFSGQILEKGTPVEFRVVVAGGPEFGPTEVDVEMEVDDHVVDRRRIDLGPSSRVALTFHETFAEDGIHLGSVVIRGAAGPQDDDRRHFTLRTARAAPVLVVCHDERARRYIEAALAPEGGGTGSFSLRTADTHELESASRARETVIVLADVERLSDRELAGIKAFLSEGGGLLVFPGPRTDAAAWGRSFLPKFVPGTLADLRVSEEPFRIAHLDPSHPLFELFRGGDGGLTDVAFTRALQFRAQAGSAVLATFTNGDPALVESSLLPGRVLLFTSSLDPSWSDFPLTGAFLPLLHESVRYLSETAALAAEQLDVGEGATVWLPAVPDGGTVTLRAPNDNERSVAPVPGPGGYALELAEADEPGFWTFQSQAGDTLAALAASISATESDLTRVEVAQLEAAFGDVASVLEGDAGLARQMREARMGREIGRWFLWAAAALLLAEMFVASRFRGPAESAA
ncbi:MAG: hypothetical protein DHS20C21_04870 [Gemmatimonadota bacterium]|nr:MAG: hypothetical protein DHS20C21_04870 [Gemmatimonadota bacterium]